MPNERLESPEDVIEITLNRSYLAYIVVSRRWSAKSMTPKYATETPRRRPFRAGLLVSAGLTILIVEQDVKRTLQIADHAYVLENGSHVLNGPAGDVLNNPKVKQSYLGL